MQNNKKLRQVGTKFVKNIIQIGETWSQHWHYSNKEIQNMLETYLSMHRLYNITFSFLEGVP
jgi:hypothetical protein